MIKILCVYLFLSFHMFAFSKTLIFTTAFNRPDFVELQCKLFAKFLEDDYEFHVVSDAQTVSTRNAIEFKCKELGINCINVPQAIHDLPYLPRYKGEGCNKNSPNVRHCTAAQWAWNTYFSRHEGPVLIIDSDMFLIRPLSIEKLLENKHFAGVLWGTEDQITKEPFSYLWLALIFFNNQILPDRSSISFNCGKIPETNIICDSGGQTGLYLRRFKGELNIHYLDWQQGHKFYCPYRYAPENLQNFSQISQNEICQDLRNRKFTEDEINLVLKKPYTIELIHGNHFLHYRAGINYEKYSEEFISKKDRILFSFFETILAK